MTVLGGYEGSLPPTRMPPALGGLSPKAAQPYPLPGGATAEDAALAQSLGSIGLAGAVEMPTASGA